MSKFNEKGLRSAPALINIICGDTLFVCEVLSILSIGQFHLFSGNLSSKGTPVRTGRLGFLGARHYQFNHYHLSLYFSVSVDPTTTLVTSGLFLPFHQSWLLFYQANILVSKGNATIFTTREIIYSIRLHLNRFLSSW